MSEFERTRRDSAGTDFTGQQFPEDFSLDEAAFAKQLRELYPLEEEILPPHFIQTVMDDSWHAATPPGYEQKLTYSVFSRLDLPRGPLFPLRSRTPWNNIRNTFTRSPRPLAASLVAVALLMVFSIVVASPSFAAGMQLLLAHTGVRQVSHYPADIHTTVPMQPYKSAMLIPNIPVSWLGLKAGKYLFDGAQALPAETWSDGPIVDVQYSLPQDSPGSGVLDIREFKVASHLSAVLQVVQEGSATWLSIDGIPAVYVNGTWMDRAVRQQPLPDAPTWKFGQRSELMIEKNGVVFWIVGDQRDGATQQELVKLARQLAVTNSRILRPNPITLHALGESFMQIFQATEGHELYYLVPRGATLTSDTGFIVSSDNISY